MRPLRMQGSITFLHEELGEIWYELKLKATESEPIRLPLLRAELGKTSFYERWLKNPSNTDTNVDVFVSNMSNYDVYPESLFIRANSRAKVKIVYTPSQIDTLESSEIVFSSSDIGKWTFLISGEG